MAQNYRENSLFSPLTLFFEARDNPRLLGKSVFGAK
jgi:hypothetical protein